MTNQKTPKFRTDLYLIKTKTRQKQSNAIDDPTECIGTVTEATGESMTLFAQSAQIRAFLFAAVRLGSIAEADVAYSMPNARSSRPRYKQKLKNERQSVVPRRTRCFFTNSIDSN